MENFVMNGEWVKKMMDAQGRASLVTELAYSHQKGEHEKEANPKCLLCWPSQEQYQEYYEKHPNE